MKFIIAGVIASPWIVAAGSATDIAALGKELGAAGLLFFLIAIAFPKLLASHRADREDQDERHREDRQSLVDALSQAEERRIHIQKENREAIKQMVADHTEASKSGHEAAAKLAESIKELRDEVRKD